MTESSVDLVYTSTMAVYGFQFGVDGVSITGATPAPFDVSSGTFAENAFSMSAASLPAGSATLATSRPCGTMHG